MDNIPAVGSIQQPETRLDSEARHVLKSPHVNTQSASTPKDVVELSPEAVLLLVSENSVNASIDAIKTQNGITQSLQNVPLG